MVIESRFEVEMEEMYGPEIREFLGQVQGLEDGGVQARLREVDLDDLDVRDFILALDPGDRGWQAD